MWEPHVIGERVPVKTHISIDTQLIEVTMRVLI